MCVFLYVCSHTCKGLWRAKEVIRFSPPFKLLAGRGVWDSKTQYRLLCSCPWLPPRTEDTTNAACQTQGLEQSSYNWPGSSMEGVCVIQTATEEKQFIVAHNCEAYEPWQRRDMTNGAVVTLSRWGANLVGSELQLLCAYYETELVFTNIRYLIARKYKN